MRHQRNRVHGAFFATLLTALSAGHAQALTINLSDVGVTPMTSDQFAAFRRAADEWEDTFSDPITININIAFNNLDDNILGSTRTTRTTHLYTAVINAMAADADNSAESAAVAALPASLVPIIDINGERTGNRVTMATANAKALGLGTSPDSVYGSAPPGVDAVITFNTDFTNDFDYDDSDGINGSQTDFTAVARHEIAHGLGFFSVTDVQDGNAGFVLYPNTLDLWRFEETGGSHGLGSEPRLLTAGDAEYFDSVRNNITLSHGVQLIDPLCDSGNMRCQASHWSDDRGLLMDPTLAPGVQQGIESTDTHALNYVGYNRRLQIFCCIELIPLWDLKWFWLFDEPPFVDGPFPPVPRPLPEAPEWANLGWLSTMELGALGFRSGVGFARFEESGEFNGELIEPEENFEGQVNLNPPAEPVFERPPTLFEMTFDSDQENGIPFRFSATCGELGCEYDPTIGDFGGYRIPGVLDAQGDGEEDIDARVTLIVAADETVIPDPEQQNVFKLAADSADSNLLINDYEAFGLEAPLDSDEDGVLDSADNCTDEPNADQRDTNGDGYGNVCDADLNNDGVINVVDLGRMRSVFFDNDPDADLNGDGVVNVIDLGRLRGSFFGAPGPSGIAP
ncbi:MAG: NF038122 family metalloprotease [Gammaproteobacteria bacterium]